MPYIDKISLSGSEYDIKDSETAGALETLSETVDNLMEYGDAAIPIGTFEPGGINGSGANLNTENAIKYSRRSTAFLPISTNPVTAVTKNGILIYFRIFNEAGAIVGSLTAGSSTDMNELTKEVNLLSVGEGAAKYKIVFSVAPDDANIPNLSTDNFRITAGHMLATSAELAATNQQVAANTLDIADIKKALIPEYTALFRNVACIGDSLTRGYFSAYGSGLRNRDFGYPFALSRMTGMKIWDYGLSGADPGEWMANATMAAQDFSGFELALVAFGQNIDKPDGGGNYTEDEYKPLYLSVIEKLKTANPNMVIFCMSNPGPRTAVNAWIQNFVTAANASPYNYSFVYYLDITNPDYAAHRTDGTHLDPIGYLLLAQTIKDKLTAFIGDNISDFSGMWVPKTLDSIITTPVE